MKSNINTRLIETYFVFSLLFILLSGNLFGLSPVQEPLRTKIQTAIELSIKNQFETSISLYQELIDQYPNHPIGYFYKGATLQAQMLDAENYSSEKQFYNLMGKAIQYSDSLKSTGNADAWVLFYEGSAYLYRSFLKSKKGKWLAAYQDAVKGVDRLENAIKRDSLLYDAYLGIGSFKYWKSVKAKFLLWLPFISDEREKGIEMVRTAVEKGLFVPWIARDQLCWILLDAGKEQEALKIAKENFENYPSSRFFKWTLVETAFKCDSLDLSYRLYRELLQEVRQISQNNHYNEIDCLVQLAKIDLIRENWEEAFEYSHKALSLQLEKDIRERAISKLETALEIRTKAQKALAEN